MKSGNWLISSRLAVIRAKPAPGDNGQGVKAAALDDVRTQRHEDAEADANGNLANPFGVEGNGRSGIGPGQQQADQTEGEKRPAARDQQDQPDDRWSGRRATGRVVESPGES